MGCSQNLMGSDSKYEIETEIRKWESSIKEFYHKDFLDVVFELNTKIHLDGEVMNKEKFENYFLRSYDKRSTQEFFENEYIKKGELYDTLKMKNLLFLITNAKRIETVKNCFFYDKANYLFSYVKDYDRDDSDYIDSSSPGLKIFIHDLLKFSLGLIPSLWLKNEQNSSKFEDNTFFQFIKNIDKISEHIIYAISQDEANFEKGKITIDDLNEMFDRNPKFLSSGYLREYALDLSNK